MRDGAIQYGETTVTVLKYCDLHRNYLINSKCFLFRGLVQRTTFKFGEVEITIKLTYISHIIKASTNLGNFQSVIFYCNLVVYSTTF